MKYPSKCKLEKVVKHLKKDVKKAKASKVHKAKKVHVKKAHSKAVSKAMKHPDKLGAGAKKRKHLKGKSKVEVVMKEFKRGTLRSGGSGKHVTNPKQAIAIGLSEARKAGAKIPKKKK
ncbi:MAG: DUF6496 domain-containing protein [Candidatus Babeliales bacterium]